MSQVNVASIVKQVIADVESMEPSESALSIHLLKWSLSKSEKGTPREDVVDDLLISHSLEQMRKQIEALHTDIGQYFDEYIEGDEEFIIYWQGDPMEVHLDVEHIEKYVREFILTPRILSFYAYYVERMKERQISILLQDEVNQSNRSQDDIKTFLSSLSMDQREYLLEFCGIINNDLRKDMARIRGRRNNIIHSLEAGYLDEISYSIDDLDLCVETMQALSELDETKTTLGYHDSMINLLAEGN